MVLLARLILASGACIRRTGFRALTTSEHEVQIGEHPLGPRLSPDTHGRRQACSDIPKSCLYAGVETLINPPKASLSDRYRRVVHLVVRCATSGLG